ncbi:MAG: DNA mismatch repair protein MutT, partial [Rhodanobacteraceae bacterium]
GPPSSGLATEIVAFFVATQLRRVGPGGGDESEQSEGHAVPLDRLPEWLKEQAARGALVDPKIYAGLYFAEHVEET